MCRPAPGADLRGDLPGRYPSIMRMIILLNTTCAARDLTIADDTD
jgi:hypothetical protein